MRPVSVIATDIGPFVAGADSELIDPGGPQSRQRRLAQEDTASEIAVSPDGRLLARVFQHHVQVLDPATGANVGPALAADIPAMDTVERLAFSPDGRKLLARTLYGHWLRWPIAVDARSLPQLAGELERAGMGPKTAGNLPTSAERAALRARDPGPWRPPEFRPSPPIARWLDGLPIPARAPGTSPLLLDMPASYNFAPETVSNTYFSVLPALRPRPAGVQRIAGVDYDLRGMVQVGGPDPEAGIGIAVPAVPVAALHLLMTVSTPAPIAEVRTVAQVRLHYRDGSQAILPIRTQREVPGYTAHDQPVPLAWAQASGVATLGGTELVLSAPRLVNPYPLRLIRSLDLEIADTGQVNSSVCLAITIEPVIPASIARKASRQEGDSPMSPGAEAMLFPVRRSP